MIGWTSIDSVFGIKPDKAYPFFKGTARTAIASRDSESRGATAGNMQFEIARSENVLEVANLFPSSVIVGHDEVVPGIHHEHLPNTPNSSGISIVETRDIYIEQVVVTLSPDVLRSVKEDCRQFRLRKYGINQINQMK